MMRLITTVAVTCGLVAIAGFAAGDERTSGTNKDSDVKGELKLAITTPAPNSQVPLRMDIMGTVTDPKAKVVVIVHPVDVSDYWVQPPVIVRSDGRWRVTKAYFGEEGTPSGTGFEIIAIGNPKSPVRLGKTDQVPDAEAISDPVDVTRK